MIIETVHDKLIKLNGFIHDFQIGVVVVFILLLLSVNNGNCESVNDSDIIKSSFLF
ncbi:hypothetical protein [Spiroplasma endosymbiont of Notiophilus biguttatus]|uniref:hypothetical protein n=1 Tax=Spiroplasma endosymbiont of Notiophilus biguttatus TaxID=3066285 RepID=UPI00313AEBA9